MPPESSPSRFSLAAAIGLFALAFMVLSWPWLSGRVTIPWDAKSQFFPQLSFMARAFAQGQSPFWTPNLYAGWPQIADPQSLIFSPLHLLLAALTPAPTFQAADAIVFAMLFVGGLGIILICRERGWHIAGALIAALAFAFGGSNAARLQHIGLVESLATLPLALFLLMRALDRSSIRWGAAAGLVAGLTAIGRDQVALLGMYLLIGFVAWHWLDGEGVRHRIVASLRPLIAGAFAGALIVTVPVLMTALLAADSNRPVIGFDVTARGSLHPANLLHMMFADLFGAANPAMPYWGPPSFPWKARFGSTDLFHAQNIGQLYMGALVPVALIGWGLARGGLWAREVRFFVVALVFALLYALGKYTPAFFAIYEILPGVDLFRRPADATFVVGFLLAIVTGYGVHRALTDPLPVSWQSLSLAIAIVVALAAVSLALGWAIGPWRAALWAVGLGIASVGLAFGALLLARRLNVRSPVVAAILLTAFCVGDLAINNPPHESNALPPQVYDALRPDTNDETVALLRARLAANAAPDRRDRVELIGIAYHWPNLAQVHGFDHLFGQNPLRLRDFELATNAQDTVAIPEQRMFSRLLPFYRSTLENLFGVRFIATGVPVEQIDPMLKPGNLTLVGRTRDAFVYENPRALPRVMVVSDWRIADFEKLLAEGAWPDVDPRQAALLESAPAGFEPSTAGGTAALVRYANTEVLVEADAPSGGLLLLNDVWHPWWRASVDGIPVEILKANVLFRAVALMPGKHVVRFTFHPFAGAWADLRKQLVD